MKTWSLILSKVEFETYNIKSNQIVIKFYLYGPEITIYIFSLKVWVGMLDNICPPILLADINLQIYYREVSVSVFITNVCSVGFSFSESA